MLSKIDIKVKSSLPYYVAPCTTYLNQGRARDLDRQPLRPRDDPGPAALSHSAHSVNQGLDLIGCVFVIFLAAAGRVSERPNAGFDQREHGRHPEGDS